MGSHNPPPFRARHPCWHSFLSPIDVGLPPNPPPSGPNILAGTSPRVYPLRGTTSSLTYDPVSGSNSICNVPCPPLIDIYPGFLFRVSPQGFKTRLLQGGFYILIKGVSFSSPTNVGSHRGRGRRSREC